MKQSEFVASIRKDFDTAKELAGKMKLYEPELFTVQPSSKEWSAGQCIDHCVVAMNDYLKLFEKKAEELESKSSAENPGDEEIKHGLLAKFLFMALDPKKGRKVPAPKQFMPASDKGIEQLDVFLELLDQFAAHLKVFEKHSMTKEKIPNPVMKLFKLKLTDAYQIHAWHNLRHIDQAERAISAAKKIKNHESE